jgi:hypothetical protein
LVLHRRFQDRDIVYRHHYVLPDAEKENEGNALMCGFSDLDKLTDLKFVPTVSNDGLTVDLSWRAYGNDAMGGSALTLLQGTTDIAVSHGSWIKYPGCGHGNNKHKATLEAAKLMGMRLLICTVNRDNHPQLSILYKNGWKAVNNGPSNIMFLKEL